MDGFTLPTLLSCKSSSIARWNRDRHLLKALPSDEFSELTSTLARIDNQWKIQQQAKAASRWKTVPLSTEGNDDFVYLLEPPYNSIPSCIIMFIGGAGLGTYPHIAYNEFLLRLSNRLNAAVITTPYQVGLDHLELAKTTGDRLRRAIVYCEDKYGFSDQVPVFSLSHSLGAKLTCIYFAATEQSVDGVGYIAFNNYSFSKTLSMVTDYAKLIGDGSSSSQPDALKDTLQTLFNFAELAVNAAGLEFSPSPSDTERIIQQKYPFASKTSVFTFLDDNLDDTTSFVDSVGDFVRTKQLPGTHLTPVYFKFSVDDLPEEAQTIMAESSDFQNVSFGDEDELESLVESVKNWILGKDQGQYSLSAGESVESGN